MNITRLPGGGLAAGAATAVLRGRCAAGPHYAISAPGWSGWAWSTRDAAYTLRSVARADDGTQTRRTPCPAYCRCGRIEP